MALALVVSLVAIAVLALPSPAGELILDGCQVVTTDEARAITQALVGEGMPDTGAPYEIGFALGGRFSKHDVVHGSARSHPVYLWFKPSLPDTTPC